MHMIDRRPKAQNVRQRMESKAATRRAIHMYTRHSGCPIAAVFLACRGQQTHESFELSLSIPFPSSLPAELTDMHACT
jgi:hypothetical protein